MRYDKKTEMFDTHIFFSAEEVSMIERLRDSRPGRRQERKISRVIRDAIRAAYQAQFGDAQTNDRPTTRQERGE